MKDDKNKAGWDDAHRRVHVIEKVLAKKRYDFGNKTKAMVESHEEKSEKKPKPKK